MSAGGPLGLSTGTVFVELEALGFAETINRLGVS